MNNHQKTLRDLEQTNEPSAFEVVGYFALFVAAVSCIILTAFQF